MTEASLAERLSAAIAAGGPISLAKYMAASNAHYYGTRDPLGVSGDFTTAPEISQMFGEIIGLWHADMLLKSGREAAHYVELGPGRGTLAADAIRAMRSLGLDPQIHFVETSPMLRQHQALHFPDARWHSGLSTLPTDAPLMVVANEFLDALPVHQIVKAKGGWRQRMLSSDGNRFEPVEGELVPVEVVPESLHDSPEGSIIETSPESVDVVRQLAQRIGAQGGAAIFLDYGYDGPAVGDTIQAVAKHRFVSPFDAPGEIDITAHVDFATIGAMAELCGVAVHGPVEQGYWLQQLGIDQRASALALAQPERSADIMAARRRLIDPKAMGRLFRAIGFSSPDWPRPAGFA